MRLFLKNVAFTVLVPGTVAVGLPLFLARHHAPAPAALRGLAALPLLAGAATYFWCLWDFASFGRGTPAPIDAPKRLVIRGLYRHVRNPMYVGVLLVILGLALWFASAVLALYACLVFAAFQTFIVLYEEPTLRRLFGADYARYAARVPRWLPRPDPGPGSVSGGDT